MENAKNDSKDPEGAKFVSQSAVISTDEASHALPTGHPSSNTPPERTLPLSEGSCQEGLSQEDKRTYVTGWKLFSLMFALITSVFVVLLDMIIIVTAIPKITSAFESLPDIGWYGAAYNLARYVLLSLVNLMADKKNLDTDSCVSSAFQPLAGKFYTYFQTKVSSCQTRQNYSPLLTTLQRTFLAYLLVFEVGSLVCALATSSSMFIAGRIVAGIGSSGLQSGAFSIISDAAPLAKQPFLIGTTMALVQLATASGPLIGGALTEYASWRWCKSRKLAVSFHAPANIEGSEKMEKMGTTSTMIKHR